MTTPRVESALKRNLPAVAAIAVAIGLIFWIAGWRDVRIDGKTEITFWMGWAGDEAKVMQALVDEYNAANPDVFVKMVSIAGSYEKLKIAFAGRDTPDVCATVWAPEVADYAIRGALAPLDGFLAESGMTKDFYPKGLWDIFEYDGRVYALSMGISTNFVAYNKQVFREAGLDPENPPRTTEEFEAAVEATTRYRDGDPAKGLERMGFSFADNLFFLAIPFGVNYWDAEKQEVLPNPERLVACLEWMKHNVDKTGLQQQRAFSSGFGNMLSPNNPFITGKIAMQRVGDWYASILRQYAPTDFEWGWMPLPVPPGGRENATYVDGSFFVIPEACRNKPEAWAFLRYICAPEQVRRFRINLDTANNPPPLRAMYGFEEYDTPFWKFTISLAESPNLLAPPEMPMFQTMADQMSRLEEQVLSGQRPAKEAVMEFKAILQRDVDRVLRTAGKK